MPTFCKFDIFPNWLNSLPTATLQMIGHALLSANFRHHSDSLANVVLWYSSGLISQWLGVQSIGGESFLIFINFFCQLPCSIRKNGYYVAQVSQQGSQLATSYDNCDTIMSRNKNLIS